MSRFMGRPLLHDASLHEYYEACAEDDSDGEPSGSESDQDSGNYWRLLRNSPLRGKARLSLYQRKSVQNTLQLRESHPRRGHDAAAVAETLAKPLGVPCDPQEIVTRDLGIPEGSNKNTTTATIEERIIFDALCALRQSPNMSFETSVTAARGGGMSLWVLRRGEAAARSWEGVSLAVRTLAETIISGANDVAKAQWQLHELAASLFREDIGIMDDTFTDYSATCTGDEGLFLASHLVLTRFSAVVRALIQDISKWTLWLQEEVTVGEEEEAAWRKRNQKLWRGSLNFTTMWWADLQRMVEKTLVPLRRCIHLVVQAWNLSTEGESDRTSSSTVKAGKVDTVARASNLMDYLIVRLSALQDGNTMDLYRFYMVLLVHCSWPYVLLMTSAIFGFVTDIDADTWRSKVPRIFRLSFSHIRAGEGNPRMDGRADREAVMLPTDILSLVLLCVGYRQGGVDDRGAGGGGRQWRADRMRRRAAFAEMLSSRSFILRSFVNFSRQRVLVGWSRKRSASRRLSVAERPDDDGESWRTVLKEWESWRFMQKGEATDSIAIDSLPLALCSDGERDFSLSMPNGIFWAVQIEERKNLHDVLLLDVKSRNVSSFVELWLHPSLPAARWVTASLLVPIGQVVQRLQERWLTELLSNTPRRHYMMCGALDENNLSDDHELPEIDMDDADNNALFAITTTATAAFSRPDARESLGSLGMLSPYTISFRDAVKLLMDVALCRDSERIVHTFLYRLFLEPHWWFRRNKMEYASSGTASSFISTAFADSIRGNELAQFVRLSVAPKEAAPQGGEGGRNGEAASKDERREEGEGEEERVQLPALGSACAVEVLRTFASFELIFSFPPDVELILLPQCLSVAWGNAGILEEQYGEYFWKNRSHGGRQRQRCDPHQLSTSERRARVRDTWSYCFGYLCSLYYTQISLREQRKRLQRRDVDAHHMMSALGTSLQRTRHAAHITRGLGSAYFELSFAVDSLINFTHSVMGIVAREVEERLIRVGAESSCITLCQRLDSLVLRMLCVCFPLSPLPDDAGPLAASAPLRDCIATVLAIALDPANLPPKLVTSRTQNAIEALVAVVRALPITSVLRERLKPLLVLLTFNRFYGE